MLKSGIYIIKNMVSGKVYIGQAVDILKRWKNHKIEFKFNRNSKYLQSAYNKYGYLNIAFYVVEFCEPSKSILDKREQYWMDLYNSYDRKYGYNLSPTAGGSCTSYKHSDKTKALLSAKRKNKLRTEEAKAAIKAGWEKRKARGPVSEETKRKLSKSHKGKSHSKEIKLKMSVSRLGNKNAAGVKRSQSHIDALTKGRQRAAKEKISFIMTKAPIDVF